MVSSDPLTAARDQAFSKYGEIAHLNVGAARCSVSINSHITNNENRPLGLIGGFESIQEQPAFNELLQMGYEWLRKRQCHHLRGPIVRHTWYPFRAVVEGFNNGPQFTGEPWNSPLLPQLLHQNGFVPEAHYYSTVSHNLNLQVTESEKALSKARELGYEIRCLDPNHLERDLRHIHTITLKAFAPPWNYLFHPISFEEFKLVLGPSSATLKPELIRLAFTKSGEAVAFLYATQEGEESAIIKTLAVVPEHRGTGIAGAIVAQTHQAAHQLKLKTMIHALMRDGGTSTRISSKSGVNIYRRYQVLERAL